MKLFFHLSTRLHHRQSGLLLILLLSASLSAAWLGEVRADLREGLPGGHLDATWRDADFVRSFIGSYGFLSGLEPTVAANERELLQSVLDAIQRDPQEAIRVLRQNLKAESSAAFDFILGNLLFQTDRLDEAASAYQAAVRKFPDFRRAHKNHGLLHIRQGTYAAAIPSLTRAMELGDVDGRSYGLLGYAHLQLEQPFPAAIAYRQATLLQPAISDWQIGLVQSLMQTGRANEAIGLLDHLLQQQPSRTDLWLLQANAWLGEERPMQAALSIEMAHRLGDARERSHLLLGDIYFREGLPEMAMENFLAALDLSQGPPPAALLRAIDLFQRRREFDQASALIDAVLTRADSLSREQRHDLLRLQARSASQAGDLETARDLLEKIVEESVLNGPALIELGRIHQDLDESEQAITRFEQARLIATSERDALIALARLRVEDNDLDRAIPLLRSALQIGHDSALEDYLERLKRARTR